MSEKEQFQVINNQMREVLSKLDVTIVKVEAIYGKITGNELHPIGLIEDLESVKKEVKELKDFKKSIKWTATGIMLAGGYGGFKLIQGFIKWLSEIG